MDRTNFEQIQYGAAEDVKTVVASRLNVYPHWHNEIELVFAVRGSVLWTIGGEESVLEEGAIGIVNSMETHSIYSVADEEREANNLFFFLQFSERFMRSMFSDCGSSTFVHKLDEKPELVEIRRFLLAILRECISKSNKEKNSANSSIVHGYASAVMALLIKFYSEKEQEKAFVKNKYDKNAERLKKIFKFVSEHYKDTPSLAEAAKLIFVSPNYLSHFFKEAVGMSYIQYVNYVKAERARERLIASDDKIIDIMEDAGFSNLKNFNAVFKAHFKLSPGAYRKEARLQLRTQNAGNTQNDGALRADVSRTPGSYVDYKGQAALPDAFAREAYIMQSRQTNDAYDNALSVMNNTHGIIDIYGTNTTHDTNDIPVIDTTQTQIVNTVIVNTETISAELEPYYLNMIGLARAADLLRKTIQEQVRLVQKEIAFKYIRFHGIFNDEMCVLNNEYNWAYVDEVYDFLLSVHLKPFVELSFMPSSIAQGTKTVFHYKGNVTPPRNYKTWGVLVENFIRHLVERYGIEEVADWYFEVWNEPNLADFWPAGFDEYIRLYAVSAASIKKVSPELKVGGPALSSNAEDDAQSFLWQFLEACKAGNLPLDFVSGHPYQTHIYTGDTGVQVVQRPPCETSLDIKAFRQAMQKARFPRAELHCSEWNSSPLPNDLVHDTAFMAVYVLQNYRDCFGLCDSLAYWSLSDRLEETGFPGHEFSGGFGLLSISGLKKPQFYAFKALSLLGPEIIASGANYIVTKKDERKGNEEMQVLAWNYAHFTKDYAAGEDEGIDFYRRYEVFEEVPSINFEFNLEKLQENSEYIVEKVLFSRKHGSIFDFWLENGAINHLGAEQISLFKEQCRPQKSISLMQTSGKAIKLRANIEAHSFVLWRLKKHIIGNSI
ncbi:MAG: helix-turn-helix domain-containing protein [Spirochaetaceae bacterium]|jgi:xylan 1,4-beta-xylosidase|nr:helix-turn-helix domain-containing protein [Spirochaetaceae bacterium]